ncbi:MAG TPA: hypothetical protein VFX19_02450, partial [Dehalococcoidia bacterium]|nr:hypothetical protein [Dehalococcoidia bacterium]
NALSPAQVQAVTILPDGMTAEVIVGDRQLSLAIGKEGQNARLAAKLTGLRIDIKSQSAVEDGAEEPELQISAEPDVKRETPIWAEVAAREEAERLAAEQAAQAAAVAATAAPQAPQAPAEPMQPAAQQPVAPTAPDRPGAVRFADEVLSPSRAADVRAGGAPVAPSRGGAGAAPARRGGGGPGGRRGPGGRDEDGRGRRGVGGRAARGGAGRRSLDEEIEEELEAALEDEDFDFFGLKDEDDN